MSTKSNKKPAKSAKPVKPQAGSRLVWFEVPADDTARAGKFYKSMFGWQINPFPNMPDYHHIDTAGADETPDGGLMKRMHPGHQITTYFSVASVTRGMAKVTKLGGEVCVPKQPVQGMGYFAICKDTEGNTFALWEMNPKAK